MGVLKVKVGTDWVPVAQSFGTPTAGLMGYAQLTADFSAGLSAQQDIPGLSVTFNADPTHTYRTIVSLTANQATADAIIVVAIANAAGTTLRRANALAIGPTRDVILTSVLYETGLSGTQTRKVSMYTGSPNVTKVYGASAYTPNIAVEDVTPTAALLDAKAKGLVGMAIATATTFTTASATETDVTVTAGQAPSLTLMLDPARWYRFTFDARWSSTVPGDVVQVRLVEGGTNRMACLGRIEGAGSPVNVRFMHVFKPTSGAATVYKMTAGRIGTGTVGMASSTGSPTQFYVEDLGTG